MLIRLCGHFIDNPSHIDKLICIKGLPDEWFYRINQKYNGKELIPPWQPDVEANIPLSIRDLCDPIEVIKIFPPIEKGRDSVVDRFSVIGLRFDYMTEAGQTTWDKIERYLERMVPRDQMVKKPVLVAPNQKADFNPHEARRTVRGSLELRPTEIPVIDLRPPEAPIQSIIQPIVTATAASQKTVIQVESKPSPATHKCDQCPKVFDKERALKMHVMRGHAKKELVGV